MMAGDEPLSNEHCHAMIRRLRSLVARLITPWGAIVLMTVGWLLAVAPGLSRVPMGGPDMHIILDVLREDHSLGALWSWFSGHWLQGPDYYRPIISLVHWTDFMIWGDNPWGWRLTNALMLAATALALTWLCDRALNMPWAGPVTAIALAGSKIVDGMLYWPAWRTDAVCGLFLIFATGAAIVYLKRGDKRWLWFAAGMLLLALMSKEVALVWPAFAAVMVLVIARDRRGLALLGVTFALTGAFWLLRVHLLGHPLLGKVPMHVDYGIRRQMMALLRTLFDPIYIDVTSVYPALFSQPLWWMNERFWLAVGGDIAFIGANVFVGIASLPLLGLIWAWRLITYLPALPFARVWSFYYYIPSLGTALLYGVGVVTLTRWLRPRIQVARRIRLKRDDESPIKEPDNA